MVKLFFGLPGCGKSTLLAAFAVKEAKRISRGRSPYKYVYSNVPVDYPGITLIKNTWIGRFDLSNALILIDEATLFADSRDYKSFSQPYKQFFLLHRHYHCDIFLFTQQWDGVDKKIRVITDRVYYVTKNKLFFRSWTKCMRIPYGIIIPDSKKSSGEKLGEIIQGYSKPPFLIRLFSMRIYRPRYYKYFDSFEAPPFPAIPVKE